MVIINVTTTAPVNCLNPKEVYVNVYTPIPNYIVAVFAVYFLPIIIFFGVAGNVISLIILRLAAQKISSHFYLWWLAIFDIISLLSYIPTFWAVMLIRPYYYHIYGPHYPATWVEFGLMGKYICNIRMLFTFTARTCSIYTIVLVTVERFIMVVFPMKRAKICTIFCAKVSIIVMAIVSVLINLPWLFAFTITPKPCFPLGICVANSIMMINKVVESIILSLIPCLIIMVCNGFIIHTLRGRLRFGPLVHTKSIKKQEKDITIRLLGVSFVFFFLTIPSLIVMCIQLVKDINKDITYKKGAEADAFVISIILFVVNLAFNFIIYCLTGRNFRSAVLALLKCNLKDMRKYQAYLVTETTSVQSNDLADGGNQLRTVTKGDSMVNRDSFQQKRQLIG